MTEAGRPLSGKGQSKYGSSSAKPSRRTSWSATAPGRFPDAEGCEIEDRREEGGSMGFTTREREKQKGLESQDALEQPSRNQEQAAAAGGPVYGRCTAINSQSITVRNLQGENCLPLRSSPASQASASEAGTSAVNAATAPQPVPGDIVVWADGQARVLTPNRSAARSIRWTERTLDPRRLHALMIRSRVEAGIREFFLKRGFLETRTPLLVPCPGMEPHIRPFRTDGNAFLPTSPEFAMKRLLVGGLERIFQLCPAFRAEPFSRTHHPEFLMLEWYRAYAGYEEIMQDTEALFEALAIAVHGKPELSFAGKTISVRTPWPRLPVRALFANWAEIDLAARHSAELLAQDCKRLGLSTSPQDTWDDLYFRIWLNCIEPRLPENQAVFVTRYPASQAALAVVDSDPDGTRWARRFEAYAGGLELANAFEELTDPIEQRRRFEKDMDLRRQVYGPDFPPNPLDEGFLDALTEGMPPAGGIALGVDRLVMLLADEPDIEKTLWLLSHYESAATSPFFN
jgi:lysyl-tRNA synthetase class 2